MYNNLDSFKKLGKPPCRFSTSKKGEYSSNNRGVTGRMDYFHFWPEQAEGVLLMTWRTLRGQRDDFRIFFDSRKSYFHRRSLCIYRPFVPNSLLISLNKEKKEKNI